MTDRARRFDRRDHVGWMFTSMDKVVAAAGPDDGRVMDDTPFGRFCDRLRDAAALAVGDGMPTAAPDRADSMRYLLLLVAVAVERCIGNADPYRPMFSPPWPAHVLDWGGACPDAIYRTAAIRGDASYVLHGRLGNATSISFQVFAGNEITDTIAENELGADEDGRFELVLGSVVTAGGARSLDPAANMVLTREFTDDWGGTERSHLRIDCLVERTGPWPVHTAARVEAEIAAVADWVRIGGVEFWGGRESALSAARPNAFDTAFQRTGTKLPVICSGSWQLGPGQALVVELADPHAGYWGLQACSFWWRTLDYANCLTTFNGRQAHRDPDGVFRFVVSHNDPGVHNWLDTTGLRRGVLLFRSVAAVAATPPTTKVIRADAAAAELPSTRYVDGTERRGQLAERREHISRLILD